MSKEGIIIIIYNPNSDSYSAYVHGLAAIYDEPGFASPVFVASSPDEVKKKLKILEEAKLLKDSTLILENLVNASRPFTSGDIVDETSGTIPLMESLKSAIKRAESIPDYERMVKNLKKDIMVLPFALTAEEIKKLYNGEWVNVCRQLSFPKATGE